MNATPIDQSIAALDDQIQRLYREKEALEQQRDAVDAPALIALLISSGTHFVLHETYKGRATLLTESDGPVERAIIAYIGDLFHSDSKPIAAHVHIHFSGQEAYINAEWMDDTCGDRVADLLASLKALGIPKEVIKVSAYEHEVASHERNRARTQIELDRVRALVQAY